MAAAPGAEALAWFGRWADAASPEAQAAVLDALRHSAPQWQAQVQALIDADAKAEAMGFLDQGLRLPQGDASPEADQAAQRLGPWQLLSPIGQGGSGQVWLAQRDDGQHQGLAAIKLLHASRSDPGSRARFAREGELLARLRHPHIAQLLDAGSLPDGQRYLVLEYVQGQPLDQYCDTRALDLRQRLRLFLQVCDAVAHAHAHLIVHRDLKPGNILVSAEGHVKLLDFGVAKLLDGSDDAAALTRHAAAGLTPEYAAPEQLEGQAITTATDTYALGVVLFSLLSGQRPYPTRAQGSAASLVKAIVSEPPLALEGQSADANAAQARGFAQPQALRRALRGDLSAIVGKALKKAPAERYATVLALRDDLVRHLDSRPVRARPDGWAYRYRQWSRRHALAATFMASTLLVLLAGLSLSTWQWQRARAEAARTQAVVEVLTHVFTDLGPREQGAAAIPVLDLLRNGWRDARTRLADKPGLLAEVAAPLGLMLQSAGDLQAAAEPLRLSLAHRRAQGLADSSESLNLALQLGYVESRLGRNEEAKALFAHIDDSARRSRAAPSTPVVEARIHLGLLARREGRLDEARQRLQAAAEQARTHLGASSDTHILALQELADLARDQGDWATAQRLLASVHEASQRSHPDVAQAARFTSATLDVETGRYAAAIPALQAVAQGMQALYGPDATYTLYAHTWLSTALFHHGDWAQADAALATAQAGAARAKEPDVVHEIALVAARQALRRGLCRQALPLLGAALSHFEKGDRTQRPYAERARLLQGECALQAGEIEQALSAANQALDALRAHYGSPHLDLWQALNLRAMATDMRDGPASALADYQEAAGLADRLQPAGHPDRPRARLLLALAQARAEPARAALLVPQAVADYSRSLQGRRDAERVAALASRWVSGLPPAQRWRDELLFVMRF